MMAILLHFGPILFQKRRNINSRGIISSKVSPCISPTKSLQLRSTLHYKYVHVQRHGHIFNII